MPNQADENGVGGRDYVNSFARGLEVIRAFSRSKPRMTLSEVTKATDMTRATVRRFLLTLVREGYVYSDNKYFGLKPKVLELGYSALSSMNIWEIAQDVMNDLAESLEESCFAAVLEGESVIYTVRATSNCYINVGISVGSRVPAHAVSSGRVLLAALPPDEFEAYLEKATLTKFTPNTITSKVKLRAAIEEVRLQGWSIVDQELEIGLSSISVPIKDQFGMTVAALNVPCPSSRISYDDMRSRTLIELMEASNKITQGLMR